jgi:hypothetical protein
MMRRYYWHNCIALVSGGAWFEHPLTYFVVSSACEQTSGIVYRFRSGAGNCFGSGATLWKRRLAEGRTF